MSAIWKKIALAAPVLGAVLLQYGCDDTSALLPSGFSFPNDPPNFYTIVNSKTFPSQGQLVRVEFAKFGLGFKVYASNAIVPGPMASLLKPGGPRFGGGTLDPDPDEHQMCPDLWPDPEEFPLPDPPLPMPDYPDENPFDGLPEPPPFPDDDLMFTDLSESDVTAVNTGGTEQGKGLPPSPGAAPSRSAAKASGGRQSSVSGRIPVGAQPAGIAMTPDRSLTVVANMGEDTVSVIRGRAQVGKIKLPGSTHPYGIALSTDGTRAYVTSFVRFGGAVLVLDVPNRSVIATLPTGNFPAGVALTPDGAQAWVTSVFEDSITVVDTLTNTQAARITGVSNGWGIGFLPNGTRAYVADSAGSGGGLFVIDANSYKVITRIGLGGSPRTVAVTPTGRHVFVTNRNSNFISQIDARTNTLVRNITVGPAMEGIQFVR